MSVSLPPLVSTSCVPGTAPGNYFEEGSVTLTGGFKLDFVYPMSVAPGPSTYMKLYL